MNALTGEMNELESAIINVGALADAELRTHNPRELREIRRALIESLGAVRFLANDIRRKLPSLKQEIIHVHH